jgi:hypothetical protein
MFELLVSCLLLTLTIPGFSADKTVNSIPLDDLGIVTALNMQGRQVDWECLLRGVKSIVDLFDRNALVPYKVKIFEEHTVVKEALCSETIEFSRDFGEADSVRLLMPVKYKGERIIVISKRHGRDEYSMVGLPDEAPKIHFSACFR